MEEIWKDIKGHEGLYQVSNLGRVKSLERVDRLGRSVEEKVLKNKNHSAGYHQIVLFNFGIKRRFYIHRLVAGAFIPNTECKPQVNHIDGDKLNNRVENLEWCTQSENIKHAFKNGLSSQKGERNATSKLTKKQVLDIRKMYATGEYTQKNIADEYRTVQATISSVIRRVNWKHI